ncbi:hypothetical protein ACFVRD_46790 [Streptomyces sp. NPDC057908]|uniref:hypothetical protein n=1 Tax=Streptomyces sp. NPDC057908 TaxID=3346276 RepID=UPI0036EF5CE5
MDVVLFGSMEHVEGFRPGDAIEAGWVSSAAPAIEELLRSRGTENTCQWDDDQSRAVEALRIAVQQGQLPGQEHEGRSWTRGYTLGHQRRAHWCAEVYADVVLDDGCWNLDGELGLADAHRIVIGAPLWVRALQPDTLVRYQGEPPVGSVASSAAVRPSWRRAHQPLQLPVASTEFERRNEDGRGVAVGQARTPSRIKASRASSVISSFPPCL